jgi:hypothetical protein
VDSGVGPGVGAGVAGPGVASGVGPRVGSGTPTVWVLFDNDVGLFCGIARWKRQLIRLQVGSLRGDPRPS